MERPPVRFVLALAVLSLAACGGDGSGWVLEEAPRAEPKTISRNLGEAATLHGPDGQELQVSLDFVRRPPVPVTVSPENSTFLEVHLTVLNTAATAYSGVLADAADLAVAPSRTLAPVSSERVPTEIPLSGGIDFSRPITIAPGSSALRGKVVFQIDPDQRAVTFSLTIPGGSQTAEWAL